MGAFWLIVVGMRKCCFLCIDRLFGSVSIDFSTAWNRWFILGWCGVYRLHRIMVVSFGSERWTNGWISQLCLLATVLHPFLTLTIRSSWASIYRWTPWTLKRNQKINDINIVNVKVKALVLKQNKKYNSKFIITLNATIFASKQLAQSLNSRHVGSAFSMISVSFWISCPLKLTRWYS